MAARRHDPAPVHDDDAPDLEHGGETVGDVDTVTVDVVPFGNDVTKIDANAEPYPPLLGQIDVPIRHALLDGDGTLDGIDDEEEVRKALVQLIRSEAGEEVVPYHWSFVDEIPATPRGKVDRRALAAWIPEDLKPERLC